MDSLIARKLTTKAANTVRVHGKGWPATPALSGPLTSRRRSMSSVPVVDMSVRLAHLTLGTACLSNGLCPKVLSATCENSAGGHLRTRRARASVARVIQMCACK